MKIKDIVTAYPALQEFGLLARGIQPIMTDAKVSREEKRKVLSQLCDKLAEKSFRNEIVVSQIFKIINMKEDECKKFPNTKAQVDNIISWCPRLELHRNKLTKEVDRNRRMYKLQWLGGK